MTTITQARDDLFGLVTTALAGVTYQGVEDTSPQPLAIYYQGDEQTALPPSTRPWVRMAVIHTDGDQRSMGAPGSRNFERMGLFTIQVFTPVSDGQHLSLSEEYCTMVRNSIEGVSTTNQVWLRRVRLVDVGTGENETQWYQANVIGNFEYYEIR